MTSFMFDFSSCSQKMFSLLSKVNSGMNALFLIGLLKFTKFKPTVGHNCKA
jgi:hypothetical protein